MRWAKNLRVMQMDISNATPLSVEAISTDGANPFMRVTEHSLRTRRTVDSSALLVVFDVGPANHGRRCLLLATATGRHYAATLVARRYVVQPVERGPASRCRRHTAGDCPTRLRNTLEKCAWSAKPQANEIWDKESLV
jgi:hypothetical protein